MIDLLCLLEFYNTYEHDNVFYSVSEKMLQSFDKIGDMGTQELADYLFISSSTLYRFVKMLAYENHGQMRASQQMFMESYMCQGRYLPANGTVGDDTRGLKNYGGYLIQRIEQIVNEVDEKKIETIIEKINRADEIIFIGMPIPSAVWRLQIELVLLGKKTSAFLNPQYQIDAMKHASPNALVFMIQYMPEYSAFYLDIAKEAREKELDSVAISNIPISPTLEYIDTAITFHGAMVESDMLMIEFLLNVIGNELNDLVLEKKRH